MFFSGAVLGAVYHLLSSPYRFAKQRQETRREAMKIVLQEQFQAGFNLGVMRTAELMNKQLMQLQMDYQRHLDHLTHQVEDFYEGELDDDDDDDDVDFSWRDN